MVVVGCCSKADEVCVAIAKALKCVEDTSGNTTTRGAHATATGSDASGSTGAGTGAGAGAGAGTTVTAAAGSGQVAAET